MSKAITHLAPPQLSWAPFMEMATGSRWRAYIPHGEMITYHSQMDDMRTADTNTPCKIGKEWVTVLEAKQKYEKQAEKVKNEIIKRKLDLN